MKFTTISVAAKATFVTANPVAIPEDAAPAVAPADSGVAEVGKAAIDCNICDDFFRKCMSSIWGWYDPMACSKTCNLDTCRGFSGECRDCGYKGC